MFPFLIKMPQRKCVLLFLCFVFNTVGILFKRLNCRLSVLMYRSEVCISVRCVHKDCKRLNSWWKQRKQNTNKYLLSSFIYNSCCVEPNRCIPKHSLPICYLFGFVFFCCFIQLFSCFIRNLGRSIELVGFWFSNNLFIDCVGWSFFFFVSFTRKTNPHCG